MFREMLAAVRNSRQSSDEAVRLAQRALRHPGSLSSAEIKSLAASVLSQARTEGEKP